MIYLLASLGILIITPALHRLALRFATIHRAVERIVLVLLALAVLFKLLPEAYHTAGFIAVVVTALGALVPNLVEKISHRLEHRVHNVQLILALIGLLLHTAVDGAALAGDEFWHAHAPGHAHDHSLPLFVVLHRIPESLLLWWALSEAYNWIVAGSVLAIMGLCTIIGFVVGGQIFASMETMTSFALFQAFVAGSLLHLAWHRH